MHVLPKCDIDTRLAFGIEPNRITLEPSVKEAFTDMLERRLDPSIYSHRDMRGVHSVVFPLYKLKPGVTHLPSPRTGVMMEIQYDFDGRMRDRHQKDSIHVWVSRDDYAYTIDEIELFTQDVARFWIHPSFPSSRAQ
jgi:hypothetical protein